MYRGRFGLIAALRRFLQAKTAPNWQDLKGPYVRRVARLKARMPHDEAMKEAIGDARLFEATGRVEADIVRHYGLREDDYLIDVGCGSGRLAKPISAYLKGRYLGTDLALDLLDYARALVGRPDWRFEAVDHIAIPEADGRADMVCFFSVLTHLLHEQSYWYLQEARRVLKPGGRIVFSVIEFADPNHWPIFADTVTASRAKADTPLNVFLERSVIPVWAERLGMTVEDLRASDDAIVASGALGQAVCVLRKPA